MSSNRPVWYRRPDGTATTSHELIQTPAGAVQPSPIFCPKGHVYLPGKCLVGHRACSASACDGHLAYICRICNGATYIPPLGSGCALTAFDGRPIEDR